MENIKVGDYVICNLGLGNELIHVSSLLKDKVIGVRFCDINPGSPFKAWNDSTEREYPSGKCSVFSSLTYREKIREFND